ncbi:MAG: CoxG family protein [Gammaproteobacteria bacterium]
MNFDGEFRVNAGSADVSALLCDMSRFAPLLPTYVSHRVIFDGITDVTVAVGIGRFSGPATVRLRLEQDGERARYVGVGRVFRGNFDLHANFVVTPDGHDRTLVTWDGSLNMFGRLARRFGDVVRPIALRHIDHLITGVRATVSRPGARGLPPRSFPL